MRSRPPIAIDVFSDVVCPWCFIGKRRLDAAMRAFEPGTFEVRFRSFQLQPDLPLEGCDARELYHQKFGGPEQMQRAFDRVTEAGAPDGVRFDFSKLRRAPNTTLAHRIIHLSRQQGLEPSVVDALFRAHFEHGVDLSDQHAVLGFLATHIPELKLEPVREALERGEASDSVKEEMSQAVALGIHAVPFFVGNRLALRGATDVESFRKYLEAVVANA